MSRTSHHWTEVKSNWFNSLWHTRTTVYTVTTEQAALAETLYTYLHNNRITKYLPWGVSVLHQTIHANKGCALSHFVLNRYLLVIRTKSIGVTFRFGHVDTTSVVLLTLFRRMPKEYHGISNVSTIHGYLVPGFHPGSKEETIVTYH
jgi:hypothetical protein